MIIENKTKYGYMSYYSNDQVFADTLAVGKIYEEDFVIEYLSDYIKNSKVILDIGSHAGSHTVLYKYINPSSKIFCFEPQKKMYEILLHNISVNKFKNIETYNNGVANKNIEAKLRSNITDGDNAGRRIEYGGSSRFNLGGMQIGTDGEDIKTITIDSLFLDSCDFIKIDVEGFEPLVLIGAEKTIKKFKPVICFESNHKTISKEIADKFEVEYPVISSFEILKSYGYKDIKLVDNQYNYVATY